MPFDPTEFPGLREGEYEVTSPEDPGYNCIAWAANDNLRFWWPDPAHLYYWPRSVPRTSSLDAFVAVFKESGFERCRDDSYETGFDKIAVFLDGSNRPTHAARQLPNGKWTSKLGRAEDIEHELRALEGEEYGRVGTILKRPSA